MQAQRNAQNILKEKRGKSTQTELVNPKEKTTIAKHVNEH